MPRWLYTLINLARRLWVRSALFMAAALFAAGLAWMIGPMMPSWLGGLFGGDTGERLLSIMASSMLVVATFSIGTMVTAHQGAAGMATPRVAPLLFEESQALHAISTFIGTFVYSLVTLIALDTGLISPGGRALMFLVSLGVLLVVVITLVRWIDDIARLGQIHNTLGAIERATRNALTSDPQSLQRVGRPYDELPQGRDVCAHSVGFVQTIDFEALDKAVGGTGLQLYLTARPGTFCHRARPLARLVGTAGNGEALSASRGLDDALERSIAVAFVIGPRRTMLQDPRYGFELMGEVGAKALSPGINDPGTAIDAMVSATRSIDYWHANRPDDPGPPRFGWLHANPLGFDDLVPDVFETLIRYGGGHASVMLRLYKSLEALAAIDPAHLPAIRALAARARSAWLDDIRAEHERQTLKRAHDSLVERLAGAASR